MYLNKRNALLSSSDLNNVELSTMIFKTLAPVGIEPSLHFSLVSDAAHSLPHLYILLNRVSSQTGIFYANTAIDAIHAHGIKAAVLLGQQRCTYLNIHSNRLCLYGGSQARGELSKDHKVNQVQTGTSTGPKLACRLRYRK